MKRGKILTLLAALALTAPAQAAFTIKAPNQTAPGRAVFQADPAVLAFPNTQTGQTSAARTVTVRNAGQAAAVPTVVLSGDYVLVANGCTAALPPGGVCAVDVAFQPVASGARSGQLTVTQPAGSSYGPATVALQGNGVAPSTCLVPLFPDGGTIGFGDPFWLVDGDTVGNYPADGYVVLWGPYYYIAGGLSVSRITAWAFGGSSITFGVEGGPTTTRAVTNTTQAYVFDLPSPTPAMRIQINAPSDVAWVELMAEGPCPDA